MRRGSRRGAKSRTYGSGADTAAAVFFFVPAAWSSWWSVRWSSSVSVVVVSVVVGSVVSVVEPVVVSVVEQVFGGHGGHQVEVVPLPLSLLAITTTR